MPSLSKKNNSYLSKRRLTKGGSISNSFRRLLGKSKSKTRSKSKTGTVGSRHAVAAHTRATHQRVTNQLRRLEERNQVRRTQVRRNQRGK